VGVAPVRRDLGQDVLKAAAIVAVVALHSLSPTALDQSFAAFHIWQAVPVFLVLLGLNGAQSAQRRGVSYDRAYWVSRGQRIVLPVLIVLALDTAEALARHNGSDWGLAAIGRLPDTGPGNYFVVVMLQFVLVWPLLWRAWARSPVATLVGLVAAEAAFDIAMRVIEPTGTGAFLARACLLHYLATIGLGMWLATRSRRLIYAAAAVAIVYLAYFHLANKALLVDQQNFLAAGYAALLVAVLPPRLPWWRPVATVGQASYHVFLVQMLWFAVIAPVGNPRWFPVSLAVSIAVGVAWWRLEQRAWSSRAAAGTISLPERA
jgi:peptidoglycan/LPS O-acetylase OafA/YrhL